MRSPRATLLLPLLALLICLHALTACSDGRQWDDEVTAAERLKQVGAAVQHYAMSHYGRLPAAAAPMANDGPPVSWRVLLVRSGFVNGSRDYRVEEPWDSPHNLELLKKMPDVFKPAGGPETPQGHTRVRAILGPSTVFDQKTMRIKDRKLTLLLVETDEAVPWTKPEDWELDPGDPLKGLGHLSPGRFLAFEAQGNVVKVLTEAGGQRVLEAMLAGDGKPESIEGLIEKIEPQKR